MRNTPAHWDEEHPAVRAWLERPPTVAERTYAVRERLGIRQPSGRNRRVRLTVAFMSMLAATGYAETRLDTAAVLAVVGIALIIPDLWADLGGDR